jgi:sRNA-binding regulator protein Hfq
MNRNQPIYDRKRPHVPAQSGPDHDAYLKAALAAKTPVSVCFLDGERIPLATIRQVSTFTLLLEVAGETWLVYKNALKKIAPATE